MKNIYPIKSESQFNLAKVIFSLAGILLVIITIFSLNTRPVKADFSTDLQDIFTESFNEIDPGKQTINNCQDSDKNQISGCVFLRSIKDGSLYFGNRDKNTYFSDQNRVQGRYDDQNKIVIPGGSGAILKLNHKLEIEKGLDWDTAKILIQEENNPANNQIIDIKNILLRQTETSYFLEGASYFDISKFDSKTVQISFAFDTVDEKFNNFYGWEIYDFQVLKSNQLVASSASSSSSLSSSSISSALSSSSISSSLTSSSQSSSASVSSSSSASSFSSSSLPANSSSSKSSAANPGISATNSDILKNSNDLTWTTSSLENYPGVRNLWRTEKTNNDLKLIYNSGSNFSTGARNGGNIISSEILLPIKTANNNLTLVLNSTLNVENEIFWDIAKISVIDKSSGGQTTIWYGKTNKSGQLSLDLNPYASKSVYLKFQFDSIDSVKNNTSGWVIDSLKIKV